MWQYRVQVYVFIMQNYDNTTIPYKSKYWRGTKFGELANGHVITKFKSPQYFFYSVLFVTFLLLNDFSKLISRLIHYFNKFPNTVSANFCSHTVYHCLKLLEYTWEFPMVNAKCNYKLKHKSKNNIAILIPAFFSYHFQQHIQLKHLFIPYKMNIWRQFNLANFHNLPNRQIKSSPNFHLIWH